MTSLSRRVAPAVLWLCACPGDPVEAATDSAGSSTQTDTESGTISATNTVTGVSATMSSDSAESSTGMTSTVSETSATEASATETSATETSTTDPSTMGTTETGTTDPSTTGTTETGTTETSTTDPGTTDTGETCGTDEAMLHQDPASAIVLPGLDCAVAALGGAGVLDAATGPDWWSFAGTDPGGGCEPDTVRVNVTAGGPLDLCVYAVSCPVVCAPGSVADTASGCCGVDQVEFAVNCGVDDSSVVTMVFGDGTEQCLPFTFTYEF